MSPHAPPGTRKLSRCPSQALHLKGPVSFLNPTIGFVDASGISSSSKPVARRPRHHHSHSNPQDGRRTSSSMSPYPSHSIDKTTTATAAAGESEKPSSDTIYQVWQTRNNRKGRHALAVRVPSHPAAAMGLELPKATNAPRQILRGLWRMAVRYPVWDVSYDVAIMFTIGSVVWVINGSFVWIPLQNPASAFAGETTLGGGVTALVGATVFELGSVLLMLEAVNENRTDCFGWALEEAATATATAAEGEEAVESGGRRLRLRPQPSHCVHHHSEKRSFLSPSSSPSSEITQNDDGNGNGNDSHGNEKGKRAWQWWPTWHELTTHYFREIGFLACLAQFFGATVFWISGFTGIPPILNALSTPATNGIFWLPQVVGGTGFIVSGCLFMLEVQPNWYTPAPRMLGWHIGLWNLVGALGFTCCGALGFAVAEKGEGVEYASTLATFIGSWAFLVGSVIQWYESLDKYPVMLNKSTSTIPQT
ncbi:integral membrane protein [Apiospora arundinis]|uniref:Integral membrane protein n=1 Tax=Apiospora arundinis TaxID=335852 RepID=A0ABR2JP98_9PEZI